MHKPSLCPPPASLATDPGDGSALARQALALKHAVDAGHRLPQLRKIHFGLVCDDPQSTEAELFRRAATELGGRVAHLRPAAAHLDRASDVPATAQWLGRLYDAVECQGLQAEQIEQIRNAAGIPVFDGLAGQCPRCAMEALCQDGADELSARRYILQAVLQDLFG